MSEYLKVEVQVEMLLVHLDVLEIFQEDTYGRKSLIGSDKAAKGTEGVTGKESDEYVEEGLKANVEVGGIELGGFGGGWRELVGKF